MSVRKAVQNIGLYRVPACKMLAYPAAQGLPVKRPPHQLAIRKAQDEALAGVINRILEDGRRITWEQRHATKRIFCSTQARVQL